MALDKAAQLIRATAQYVKLTTTASAVRLLAAASYLKLTAQAITGYFLKLIDLLDSATSSDVFRALFRKGVSENLSQSDIASKAVGKPFVESLSQQDQSLKSVGKGVLESQSLSESSSTRFVKAPLLEPLSNADVASLRSGKNLVENLYKVEGPHKIQFYVDPAYFAQDYVLEGVPVFVVGKALSDTKYATDDFINTAVGDDDEVMLFGKSLVEPVGSFDIAAKRFSKAMADASSVADSQSATVKKPLSDAAASSDANKISTGKSAADVAVSSDSTAKSFGRLVGDSSASSDGASLGVGRVSADSVSSSENQALSTRKTAADVFAASEIRVVGFAKPLVDSASSSDIYSSLTNKTSSDSIITSDQSALSVGTGFLENQKQSEGPFSGQVYADATYFAGDYVLDGYPTFAVLKAASDTHYVDDSGRVVRFGKQASDTAVSSEINSFYVRKATSDVFATSDSVANRFSRGLSDSISQSDSSYLQVRKAPSDAGTTSDSGSGRKTDYANVSYFAADYVGSTFTF